MGDLSIYIYNIFEGSKFSQYSQIDKLVVMVDDFSKIEKILTNHADKEGFHHEALFNSEEMNYEVTADDGITLRRYILGAKPIKAILDI